MAFAVFSMLQHTCWVHRLASQNRLFSAEACLGLSLSEIEALYTLFYSHTERCCSCIPVLLTVCTATLLSITVTTSNELRCQGKSGNCGVSNKSFIMLPCVFLACHWGTQWEDLNDSNKEIML